jgi:hypothetical protein
MDNAIDRNMPLTFPVDKEHGALRFSVVVIFLVCWFITYLIFNALIPNEGLNLIAIIISFALTALATQQIEQGLKRRWPSGRTVQIDHSNIQLADKNGTQQQIDPNKQVNVLMWRFTIKRRSRVPKGWLMVACALEQEEAYLPVYTFMSSEQFDLLKAANHFTVLVSQKESANKKGTAQTDLRLAGEQRRLHTAENARWMTGAEMTTEDFQSYIRRLQEYFPQWMPYAL